MSFIRTKTIKGNQYAYLVENKWKRKTSKQKVKKYLGRVYSLEKKLEYDFLAFIGCNDLALYVKNTTQEDIIRDLIVFEIYSHGFKKIDTMKWTSNGIIVDLKEKTIKKNKKDIVLKLNDGFLCGHTLNKLFGFNEKGNTRDVATKWARLFIDTGIAISKDIFIEFFQKINKGIPTNFE